MRVLIDYRPALRVRSGAGEYTHELAAALLARSPRAIAADRSRSSLFSSSWKDRLQFCRELSGASPIDLRIPVSVLNLSGIGWNGRLPNSLTGRPFDVTHSSHPLLLPARNAAQVITIHDLDFLAHPERTRAEMRRDYPALIRTHAARADAVIVPSRFTAGEVERLLNVPARSNRRLPAGRTRLVAAASTAARRLHPVPWNAGTSQERRAAARCLRTAARDRVRPAAAAPPLVLAGRPRPDADALARPAWPRLPLRAG